MTAIEIINQIEADKKSRKIERSYALKLEVIKKAQSMGMAFAN